MRSEKSVRNIGFGLGMQLINALTGFIMRKVLIDVLDIMVVGLGNLFTEVIAMLSMAELGIGSAITYHLYKPIAEGDEDRICRLMSLYRKTYRVVAAAIFGLGLLLLPFLDSIITIDFEVFKDFDMSYVRKIYMLFVLQTSLSYLLTYKAAIFEASQDQFWVSSIRSVLRLVICAAGIAVVYLTQNYMLYIAVSIVGTLATNLTISIMADRKYPYLKQKKALSKEESKEVLSNVKHMFIGRLSGRITNSTDNILISAMDSTANVGFYGNYSLIITSVRKIADQIGSATVGSVGNMLATEDGPTCSMILKRMTLAFHFIASVSACVMMACMSGVITLWLGEKYIMSSGLVFVCLVNYSLVVLRSPVWSTITPSGLFKQTKYVSITGTVLNLVTSIVFYQIWNNIISIFIGTTVSIVTQLILDVYLIWKRRLNVSPWDIGRPLILMSALNIMLIGAGYLLGTWIRTGNLWLDLIALMAASGSLALAINLLAFSRTKEFSYLRWLAKKSARKLTGKFKRRKT